MDDNEKVLASLKEELEAAKTMKVRAEARLEQLQKQKDDIIKELAELGVKPEQLDAEIQRLQAEIEQLIQQARQLLPSDLLKR